MPDLNRKEESSQSINYFFSPEKTTLDLVLPPLNETGLEVVCLISWTSLLHTKL